MTRWLQDSIQDDKGAEIESGRASKNLLLQADGERKFFVFWASGSSKAGRDAGVNIGAFIITYTIPQGSFKGIFKGYYNGLGSTV